MLDACKDIVQILFFLTMSIVAILSYRQARKTVFSPIKTEIFKYQLQEFEKIINYFQNKSDVDLIKDLDIDNIVEINGFNLYKDYVQTFMKNEIKLNPDVIERYQKLATRIKLVKGTHYDYFEKIDFDSDISTIRKDEANKSPQLLWEEKEFESIFFTEKHHAIVERIKSFQKSPLIPIELRKLLSEYVDITDNCLSSVGVTIEEAGISMPKCFPTSCEIRKFNTLGLLNSYHSKRPALEPKAKEILGYVNKYLNIEKLIES